MPEHQTREPNTTLNVLVLGVGNILLSDEAAGVRVVEEFSREVELPPEVEVLDGGTSGVELLPYFDERTHLIIVDVAQNSRIEPGEVFTLDLSESPGHFQQKISPHQLGLSDVLAIAQMTDALPPNITLIGIKPKDLSTGLELSPEVRAGVRKAVDLLIRELKGLGLELVPKT
jgi:hydrogenase maturation protease